MRTRIHKSKAPDRSGTALEEHHQPSNECQCNLPVFFGPTPLSGSESLSLLPDGLAASPLLASLGLLDPVVMPFSCFVFLSELAPGPTFPSFDAPGAGWL